MQIEKVKRCKKGPGQWPNSPQRASKPVVIGFEPQGLFAEVRTFLQKLTPSCPGVPDSWLDLLPPATYHSPVDEEQYDTLLNGILSLGSGQRRLTRLMLELAQASAEQEERLDQVLDVLRKMGDTSTDTMKRISALEAEVAELKKKAS